MVYKSFHNLSPSTPVASPPYFFPVTLTSLHVPALDSTLGGPSAYTTLPPDICMSTSPTSPTSFKTSFKKSLLTMAGVAQ